MLLIEQANAYIELNVIDIEDWQDSDDERKQRIVNTAERILNEIYSEYIVVEINSRKQLYENTEDNQKLYPKFSEVIVPENAVFEYCAVLAAYFNDTNRLQQYGVGNFGITGVASFTFKQGSTKDIYDMIPRSSKEIIGKANGVKLTGKQVKWTVL